MRGDLWQERGREAARAAAVLLPVQPVTAAVMYPAAVRQPLLYGANC